MTRSLVTVCTTPLDFSYRSNVRKVQSAWQLNDESVAARSICFNWGGCPGAYRSWSALPPVNRATLAALFETAGWTVLTVKESAPDCIPLPGSTGDVGGGICRFAFEREDLYATLTVRGVTPLVL